MQTPITLSETEFDALYERQVGALQHFINTDLVAEFEKQGLYLVDKTECLHPAGGATPRKNGDGPDDALENQSVRVTAFTLATGSWPGAAKMDLMIANDGYACIAGKAWRFAQPDAAQHTSEDASKNYFTVFHAFKNGSDVLTSSSDGDARGFIRKHVAERFKLGLGNGPA